MSDPRLRVHRGSTTYDRGEPGLLAFEQAHGLAQWEAYVNLLITGIEPPRLVDAAQLRQLLNDHAPTTICLDTEFFGYNFITNTWDNAFNINKHSTVGAVKPFMVSVAFDGVADGVVFEDRAAIDLLYSYISKRKPTVVCHNAPVDYHAMVNDGLDRNVDLLDSLQAFRWFFPSYTAYDLDALYRRSFPTEEAKQLSFKDIFKIREEFNYTYLKPVVGKACDCGEAGCRKRKAPHTKHDVYENQAMERIGHYEIDVTPAYIKSRPAFWTAFLRYSQRDSAMLYRLYTEELIPKVERDALATPPVRFA